MEHLKCVWIWKHLRKKKRCWNNTWRNMFYSNYLWGTSSKNTAANNSTYSCPWKPLFFPLGARNVCTPCESRQASDLFGLVGRGGRPAAQIWAWPFKNLAASSCTSLEAWCSALKRGFPGGSGSKEFTCNAGDTGWIPGSGGSPEEGNSNPLQHSCSQNSMDRGAW